MNLPPNQSNTRHGLEDQFISKRPALSFDGFQGTSTNGLSLEQLMLQLFTEQSQLRDSKKVLVDRLYQYSTINLKQNTTCRYDVTENATILEAQAFIGLLSLLRDKNIDLLNNPNVIDSLNVTSAHFKAVSRLKASLQRVRIISDYQFIWRPTKNKDAQGNTISDPTCNSYTNDDFNIWRMTESLMLFNRAWDLYLALENAYEFYGMEISFSNNLLSAAEKDSVNNYIRKRTQDLATVTTTSPIYNGISLAFPDTRLDRVQAGNWPYICYAGVAYSMINLNGYSGGFTYSNYPYSGKAFLAEFTNKLKYEWTGTPEYRRIAYWYYQSGGGNKYWAEGPMYFKLALGAAIPVWHSIRLNNNLTAENAIPGWIDPALDPFRDDKFINPIKWLGNIMSPENESPPIDDSNTSFSLLTQYMNWDVSYGSQEVASIWARLKSKMPKIPNDKRYHPYYNLLELAIPQNLDPAANSDNELIINANISSSYTSETDEQQATLTYRDNSGKHHYLFLNGEHDHAITSGEGHEQPDQLQLLYSVNGKSILKDAGYDSAKERDNSTKNDFYHHNVPYITKIKSNIVSQDGGFASPYLPYTSPQSILSPITNSLVEIKKDANGLIPDPKRKMSLHQPAYTFLEENNDHFTILRGKTNHVQLEGVQIARIANDYERTVIFVKDNEPYLIDINQLLNRGDVQAANNIAEPNFYLARFLAFASPDYTDEYSMSYTIPFIGSEDSTHISNFVKLNSTSISATQKAYELNTDGSNFSFSIGKNFNSGLIKVNNQIESSLLIRNESVYEKSGSKKEQVSRVKLVAENAVEIENYNFHGYNENSLQFVKEIYAKQSFVGVFKADASEQLKDLFKYESVDLNTKNMVTMYFIEKNASEMDVVVTYSNDNVGNQIINLNYPAKSIALIQFANTKKGYSFFQLEKMNNSWGVKSSYNNNLYVTTNSTMTVGHLMESEGVAIADNVTLTINGGNTLQDIPIVFGNNSKIKFTTSQVNLQNVTFSPIISTNYYSIESTSPASIKIPNMSKVTVEGRVTFTGYRLQIDQGGELEIKDGSLASFTDSFSFLNYGTTKIGAGVTMNLKNFSNYSSSNTLINTNNESRTYFNISSGGVINFGGLATVKGTTFRRKTTSNFSYVGISGSAIRSFENVAIEGSQYGFLVSNASLANQTLFKNVTGNANYYSTIKSTNSSFVIDGFEGENAVQDGISAYSGSVLTLKGIINATDNLLGLRSAYTSKVNYSDANGTVTLKSNTRGIHTYNDSRVDFTDGDYFLWGNNRTDNLYGGIPKYDLYAVNTSHIYIEGNLDGIHTLSEYKETLSTITVINRSGGFQVNSSKDVIIGNENDKRSISKKAFLQAFWDAKKAENKQTLKELIRNNSSNSKQEIRSKAITLDVLNLSQEADFSWVSLFSKRAKLRSLVEEDAMLIAEQLFYYFTKEEPNQSEARYWLEQLKDMKYDVVETGIFDVLFEQAEFEQAEGSKSESETIDEEIASNVVLAYPNPFNPTTSLKLSLKNKAQVQIQVFDIMGRLVQTLANNEQWQSGTHEVQFDASRLASGMYFARTQILESGKAVQTQVTKLMLIK